MVAVPTISNAAPNDFVVTAHTTTPSVFFVSDPASGQSVDNLAPAIPTGSPLRIQAGRRISNAAANTEADLGGYARLSRHFGGSSRPASAIGSPRQSPPTTRTWVQQVSVYKVSAVDVNGNESGFASAHAG